jgi:hypothetical protein
LLRDWVSAIPNGAALVQAVSKAGHPRPAFGVSALRKSATDLIARQPSQSFVFKKRHVLSGYPSLSG